MVVQVEIDQKSGFCFGVVRAVQRAEEELRKGGPLYSLGNMVHNEQEVKRLADLGLKTIDQDTYFTLRDCRVLIRAHGEPPATYEHARQNNIELIDATCPVVSKLQQRVRKASEQMTAVNGQVVVFGHPGHAEVVGLVGQADDNAVVVDHPDDLQQIDPSRPVIMFSQTTMSVDGFRKLKDELEAKTGKSVEAHDTICRQVAGRVPHLQEFAGRYDVVVFVGGKQSSNARVLYTACRNVNERSYFVSLPEELNVGWFSDAQTVGICGATSTPQWLMDEIAEKIRQL